MRYYLFTLYVSLLLLFSCTNTTDDVYEIGDERRYLISGRNIRINDITLSTIEDDDGDKAMEWKYITDTFPNGKPKTINSYSRTIGLLDKGTIHPNIGKEIHIALPSMRFYENMQIGDIKNRTHEVKLSTWKGPSNYDYAIERIETKLPEKFTSAVEGIVHTYRVNLEEMESGYYFEYDYSEDIGVLSIRYYLEEQVELVLESHDKELE